ncbi:tetratricopeptide repeat protein [Thalassobacillus devorans]|uniref:tetratricopeptide repeat protein n=1 Tax=Thalassobacillus devorans TaxID=279813 RepID=UPI00048FBBBC|nr:tetratricopeptide repeat protein [Thalassobacillus devorans]
MNIGKRVQYIMHYYHLESPNMKNGSILPEEWTAILQGRLPLRMEQAIHLAEYWNIPLTYLTDYDQTDIHIHRLLQDLQHELLTKHDPDETIIAGLMKPMSISSITQEIIFHLLKAVYHYKYKQFEQVKQIENEYLAFMLPDHNILKESAVFQRALFYFYGFKYFYEGKREESLAYFARLLDKTTDRDEIVSIIQNLSLILKENGEYDRVIHYMERLKRYSQEQEDEQAMSAALNYLGAIYIEKKAYRQAIHYFEQMKKLDLSPRLTSRLYHNLGVLYFKLDNFKQAIEMYETGKELKEAYGMKDGLFLSYHALFKVYHFHDDKPNAEKYFEKAHAYAKDEGEETLLLLAKAQTSESESPEQALQWYDQALDYYERHTIKGKLESIYPAAAKLAEQLGKYQKANEYQAGLEKLHNKNGDAKQA